MSLSCTHKLIQIDGGDEDCCILCDCCIDIWQVLFCVLFVFENSSFANFMAFVLIWDCCILCDSVCSGPADYVNLMGEGRRYHNCSVPTNALGCDTVVSYCVCLVGWLEKYVLWRVQQSWRRWLADGYHPCSDISTPFDHSLILNFRGQFLLPQSVSSIWIILCIFYLYGK